MNFVSFQYLAFLLIVWGTYLFLPRKGQNWLLLIGSYYFYAAWDWRFLSLICLSTGVDFIAAKVMMKLSPTKFAGAL